MHEGWTRVAFGDVVRLSRERSSDPIADGFDRYVGLEHLDPGDLKIRRWGNTADGTTFTNVFRPGQVLFGKRRSYQRKVAVADFEGVCSGDVYVFEPRGDQLLPELLPFVCQSQGFFRHAIATSAGSLSPRTKWASLASFEMPLPPRQEQSRLTDLLVSMNTAERELDAARRRLSIVREVWIDSALAGLANDAPVDTAPNVLDRLTVGIVVKPADLYVQPGEGVPALRSLNVVPGHLVLDELVEISWDGHRDNQKSSLKGGDVVVVRTGRPGDAAVIDGTIDELNAIDLVVCTPNKRVLPAYFCATLNSAFGRRQFAAGIAGTAQVHFNVGSFKSFTLPVPDIATQEGLVKRLATMDAALAEVVGRIGAADALRSDAMRRVFEL